MEFEKYVHTEAGDPFRIFPFGKIFRDGEIREVTSEIAASFVLPHFKPPIKLGSHNDETPAGGHIIALEVRDDGLYAVPEYTDKGNKAIEEGDYRYNSPEIIWADQAIENPETGEWISGPMIVGVALLHEPHLGEATAMYRIKTIEIKELNMEAEVVSLSILEKAVAILRPEKVEEVEPEVVMPENYEAEQEELSELRKDKAERKEADAKAEALSAVKKEFDTEEFGISYIELGKADEAAEMLAGMSEEQREWVLVNFKALSAQIDAGVTGELGNTGDGETDPNVDARDVAVKAYAAEHEVGYVEAFKAVLTAQPELFEAKE